MNGKYTKHSNGVKVLSLILTMVLVAGLSVAGTLAWLTAETKEVKNTFTSAELFDDAENDFTLWEYEAVLGGDGTYTLNEDNKVESNTYKILPGVDLPKNPTVDVNELKEYGYLFIAVGKLPLAEGLTATVDEAHWTKIEEEDGVLVYVYSGEYADDKNIIQASAADPKTFEVNILTGNKVEVSAEYEGTNEVQLSFRAYMVQAAGNGSNAAEAWMNTYGATSEPIM